MSDLLSKNLEELRSRQPLLAQRIFDEMGKLPLRGEVRVEETPSGRWVKGLGEPFFDRVPEAGRVQGECHLVLGVGYPPYLFKVLRSLPKDALSVVVLEPSLERLLATLSATSVYMALPKGCRLSFVVWEDPDLLEEALFYNVVPLGIYLFTGASRHVHRGIWEAHGQGMSRLEGKFWDAVRHRIEMLGNSPEDTLLGIRHGALNLLRILRGVDGKKLIDLWGGRPAVCVSSGPSLKKNVDLLKGEEDRFLIIACDTSLIKLLRRGIVPHAVVTIERNSMYELWMPAVLEEFPEECKRILLVSQSVSEPLTAGRWPGPVFVVGKMDSPADTWLVKEVLNMNTMTSGMSVAHMAMCFAVGLGCPKVALIGQDLSFDDDGLTTHAEGVASLTPEGIAKELSYQRLEVDAIGGGKVKTHYMWYYFLQIFERLLSGFGDDRVFQCSERGADIRGAKPIPLREFMDRFGGDGTVRHLGVSETKPRDVTQEGTRELLSRISRAKHDIDFCLSVLDEMDQEIDRAASAGLPPTRRRQHALKIADLLDRLHGAHRALAFIGQSYTHLSGVTIARTRFLETVEQVRDWERVHREMVASHRVNLRFMSQWLDYMEAQLSPEALVALSDSLDLKDRDLLEPLGRALEELLGSQEPDLLSPLGLCISDMLCRVDILREEGVSPELLWMAAKFLYAQGRAFEARHCMGRAYGMLEGREAEAEKVASFFIDWALIEGANDLIRAPQHELAVTLLDSAKSVMPQWSQRIDQLKQEVLASQRRYVDAVGEVAEYDLAAMLLGLRNSAQRALMDGDLPRAFEEVMKMEAGLERYPGDVVPHFAWLARTSFDVLGCDDTRVDQAARRALDFIFSIRESLSKAGFQWEPRWLDYLKSLGMDVSLVSVASCDEG
ncbi:hypothetical protein TheveDRAFT_1128 [Thermanaerovibrio velox DSM 12556]|uniref:6-hydroxymethylpterin diphosphokinase MptE-like domain-containing protein n=1 Tax=Thermanaerovibrio velox DSM 12556 TaxID=926567 RepID=H0USG3_9BACT|nr:6-hydroxymethylpterin diphosphokinase MptE-like protein [Thermanaerovibrio velox]EHM10252.1 hypothetical protein TheveDRAFT_1128 [Thermanaerovibrio velox DSM 12556]